MISFNKFPKFSILKDIALKYQYKVAVECNMIARESMGNNPMVGASVAVAVAVDQALNK